MVAKSVPFDWGNLNLASRKNHSNAGARPGLGRACCTETFQLGGANFYSYLSASAGKIRAADHDG
jgi:hypothetical protein